MNTINYNDQLVSPGKIVCVGRNYVAHIEELGNQIPESMVVFMKPSSCISNQLSSEHLKEVVHYEGEICFLVESGELSGVGFGLDLTKRELQSSLKKSGLPWERAKCFDGAALFSSFVKFNGDLQSLHVKLFIDDLLVQVGGVTLMMYKPQNILKQIQSFCKLEDFDIIMSGTPSGVGVVNRGSIFRGEIYSGEQLLISQEWLAG